MRIALLTVLAAAVAAVAWALLTCGPRNEVELRFNGYNERGDRARFVIVNHTRFCVRPGFPMIEYWSGTEWIKYYDREELLDPSHPPGVFPGEIWSVERALPSGHKRWRAVVSYHEYVDTNPTMLPTLQRLLWRVGVTYPPMPTPATGRQAVRTKEQEK